MLEGRSAVMAYSGRIYICGSSQLESLEHALLEYEIWSGLKEKYLTSLLIDYVNLPSQEMEVFSLWMRTEKLN